MLCLLLLLDTSCLGDAHIIPGRYDDSRSGFSYNGDGGQREGSYYIRGFLNNFIDDYRDRDYRRRDYGEDVCPYENEENRRAKREAVNDGNVTEVKETFGGGGIILKRLRRQLIGNERYKEDWDDLGYRGRSLWGGRYRDGGYRDEYYRDDRYKDDRYRDDRYYRYGDYRGRDDQYRDNRNRLGYNRGRRDRCGREPCTWKAELECDSNRLGGSRGYRSEYVRWERENDAYYPRDKYRHLLDYFGGRATEEGTRLIISRVRPEDKGVYRCYLEGGQPQDFMEVHFYPKFPMEDNEDC